jgi:hypothetical protein
MTILAPILALSLGVAQTPAPQTPPPGTPPPAQSLSAKREVLQAVVAITTLPAAEVKAIPAAKAIEHDSEVARSEAVTVVVTIQGCQADATGVCNATADVVAYKPDGSVHSEMKAITLAAGRGTAALKLAPADVTGVYKVVATVRDLNARRFGKTERLFGVK